MNHVRLTLALPFLALCFCSTPRAADVSVRSPVVAPPTIPDRSVNITNFGAVADGQTLNTKAFAAAMDALSDNGGGRVIVPAGLWLTGPIVFRSHVELHLERGALVQFSDKRADYPLVQTSYEGRASWRCQSPISGRHLENIAITGNGILDGAGQVWRPVKKSKLTSRQWSDLVASGGVVNSRGDIWYPSAGSLEGNEGPRRRGAFGAEGPQAIKDALRPVMLNFVECKRVLLESVTFQNSPAWCLHPLMCEDLTVRGVTVRNPWYSQNGDGLDIESCRNVLVENASFDVGDDAICLKSGRDAEGRRRGRATENVVIRDCVVYHAHGGFVVGSEMSGGVRNIHVSDCTFIGTDVGLRFKSTRGRGGVVEDIHIERIRMTDIPTEAILFNLFYGGSAPTEQDAGQSGETQLNIPPVTEETPAFRNIVVRDIVCRGARRAVLVRGLPEMPVENIRLENLDISANEGVRAEDVRGLTLTNVVLKVKQGSPLSLRDAQDVIVEQFDATGGKKPLVRVSGSRTKGVHFPGSEIPKDAVEVATGVSKGAVEFE